MRAALAGALAVAALAGTAGSATAAWLTSGTGSASAKSRTMPAGNQPTATASARNVTVSWAQSSFAGGPAVSGYVVKRYDTSGSVQTIGSACTGTVSALTCTESDVPAGSWQYSVTPAQGNWRGAESSHSATVTVASPSLSFSSSTTVTALPSALDGSIANFASGQTISFRLDDPSTGTVLSGSATPSTIDSSDGATISVTIPSGTANGSHTVYAIGSGGDVAGAAITVNTTIPRTFTTTAWSVSDVSSGGTPVDASDPYVAAGGPFDFQVGFPTTFDTTHYIGLDMGGPLRAGDSTSNVKFNFDFEGNSTTACFYFDVRRISTGSVLATHGSAASPVACNSTASFDQTATALPEVTSTDIANDLEIRVYMTNSGANANLEDQGNVSGSDGSDSFTLYERQVVNQASGTATTTPWWPGAGGDGATTGSGWDTVFNASKYLGFTFPAYVPSGATAVSASFTHSYRSNSSGSITCWYFGVYQGATLLATHGSTSSPVSCNSSSTSWVTDTVSLPEINTVARANAITIRIYMKNSGSNASKRKTQEDLDTVQVDYTG